MGRMVFVSCTLEFGFQRGTCGITDLLMLILGPQDLVRQGVNGVLANFDTVYLYFYDRQLERKITDVVYNFLQSVKALIFASCSIVYRRVPCVLAILGLFWVDLQESTNKPSRSRMEGVYGCTLTCV